MHLNLTFNGVTAGFLTFVCLISHLQLLEELKALVIAEDDAAEQKLSQLKEILLDLDSLPPLCVETPSAAEERKFAMEVFEYAVILSINQMDRDSFNRYMSCLKPYYLNYARYASFRV